MRVIGTAGHVDHGKSTLIKRLTGINPDRLIEEQAREMTIDLGFAWLPMPDGDIIGVVDVPGHRDFIENMLAGVGGIDAALLVIAADEGVMPQTREHILLARQVGVPALVVFLNKKDQVDDEELLELVELEVRELLSEYKFDGDNIPIVAGSALMAVEALLKKPDTTKGENEWVDNIYALMDEVDAHIPTPEREIDKPFLMAVEDVFSITGRGTVATGRIERGKVKVGETVELVGIQDTRSTTVTGVEMFQKTLDEGMAGDNVGVLLRGINKEGIERGMVLAKPGSITPHTKFESEVYVLKKEEGGRHTPFFKGYRPQFYVRTTDVTGTIDMFTAGDGSEAEMVMPGDNVQMTITLISPIAIEQGMRFAIREGGRTIGAGVVSNILQ